jgi:hypothetical protein
MLSPEVRHTNLEKGLTCCVLPRASSATRQSIYDTMPPVGRLASCTGYLRHYHQVVKKKNGCTEFGKTWSAYRKCILNLSGKFDLELRLATNELRHRMKGRARPTLVSCSAYSLTLKMEAICYSETSVDFQRTTRRYIPEDSKKKVKLSL